MSSSWRMRRGFSMLWVLLLLCAGMANASATLLLEEPYGKLGFFTATGHAAVYLSGVCAASPLTLRPCRPGELGAVISRYDGVGGYDWVAIPLIPYLYAVDAPDDVPLYADAKLVNFLRDQYRRKHLEDVAPDTANGSTPGGNWYELVGSSYDRTIYAFEIETTSAQDSAFIEKYNSSINQSHFRTVSRNCADFAKDVINFYHPRALHRSFVADVGIATPKQMAKTLIKYSSRHVEFASSRYVIPQVPGTEARSAPVHGVVESFLKSKKYIVPSAIASPIFAGCVFAVYVGTGAGRFDPALHAQIYSANRDLEKPIGSEDRRSYQLELAHLMAANGHSESILSRNENLRRLLHNATPDLDAEGRPVLRVHKGNESSIIGIAEGNLLASNGSRSLTQELIEARLRTELKRGTPKASERDVTYDWDLLQKMLTEGFDVTNLETPKFVRVSQNQPANHGNRP